MDPTEVSSEELYRQMANDIIFYLMDESTYEYSFVVQETPEEMYNAMTTDVLCIPSMENFKVTAEAGSYVLLDNIEIQFLKLVPNDTVQLLWKLHSWPDVFFSKVNIEITKIELLTFVKVQFLGAPISEVDCKEIFEQDLWRPIRDAFIYKKHLTRWAQSL